MAMTTTLIARPVRVALIAAMLATSACASIPHLGPQPMPRAETDFSSSKTLAAPRSEWPANNWWHRYDDAQLAQLMEEGLNGSPDLAAAAARMRTAEGFAQQANAAL